MAEPSQSEILDFALALSREAGKLILPLWKNVAVDYKADGSEVTEADRGAERLIRRLIAERYPDHAILGEEFARDQPRRHGQVAIRCDVEVVRHRQFEAVRRTQLERRRQNPAAPLAR